MDIVLTTSLVHACTEGRHRATTQWRHVHPLVGAHSDEGLKTTPPARFPLLALGHLSDNTLLLLLEGNEGVDRMRARV
jgi:hypothetical protein